MKSWRLYKSFELLGLLELILLRAGIDTTADLSLNIEVAGTLEPLTFILSYTSAHVPANVFFS